MKTKTGECFWRDDAGALWLAESWVDLPEGKTVEDLPGLDCVVVTTQTLVEEAPTTED